MKIATIVGARPQFIKAAVVSSRLRQYTECKELIIHTGQHFDDTMSNLFFDEMDIPKPDYQLTIHGLDHGAMTGRMMESIEKILQKEQPDAVMVYGDTDTTLAGALTAKKLHIKTIHVEAGLRSYNNVMPEEINRIITDRISDLLFCPTQTAVDNLKKEGFQNFPCEIIQCGDVMLDAAVLYAGQCKKPTVQIPDSYVLCTVHRAENTDDPEHLCSLFKTLETVATRYSLVLPLHPRTKMRLSACGFDFHCSPISFIEPTGYLEMLYLIGHSLVVMTDSGGLQKEAFFLKKNCITLRNETEWVELTENGFNCLAGTDDENIILALETMLHRNNDFSLPLFGNGHAADIICEHLLTGSH